MTQNLLVDVFCTVSQSVLFIGLFAMFWTAWRQQSSLAEALLFGVASFTVMINAIVVGLSILPIHRPLDWLWLCELAVLAVTILVLRCLGGSAFYGKITRERCTSMRDAAAATWKNLGTTDRAILAFSVVIIAASLAVYSLSGILTAPLSWDVLSYHIPLAVQPFQDGKLGILQHPLPWVQGYPRGVGNLWFWTLYWTHSDVLFNSVQFLYAIQLLLAVWLFGERLGLTICQQILAVLTTVTMPLFYLLTTTGYTDIAVAASSLTLFFLFSPGTFWKSNTNAWCLFAAMTLCQTFTAKVPVTTLVALAVFLSACGILRMLRRANSLLVDQQEISRDHHRHFWAIALTRQILAKLKRAQFGDGAAVKSAGRKTIGPPTLVACAAIILLGLFQYIQNTILYSNPIFPLRLTLLGKVVFEGPLDPALFGSGVSSTFGKLPTFTTTKALYATYFDWYTPLTVDSLGSYGPTVGIVCLGFALMCGLGAIARLDVVVGGAFMAGLLSLWIPASFVPRYGLMFVVILIPVAFNQRALSRRGQSGLGLAVLILSCFTSLIWMDAVRVGWLWNSSHPEYSVWNLRQRNSFMPKRHHMGEPFYPGPGVVSFLHEKSTRGKVLVWNVTGFSGLLWNREYSNRSIFLAGCKDDYHPQGAHFLKSPTEPEMKAWIRRVQDLGADHVLVYTKSAYAKELGTLDNIYRLAYADSTEIGDNAMSIYERIVR